MNTVSTSYGDRLTTSVIDSRIRKAKAKKYLELEFNACERCNSNQGRLDMSHIISVKECKESGRAELAYTVDNLELLCRDCHNEIESRTKEERESHYLNK